VNGSGWLLKIFIGLVIAQSISLSGHKKERLTGCGINIP